MFDLSFNVIFVIRILLLINKIIKEAFDEYNEFRVPITDSYTYKCSFKMSIGQLEKKIAIFHIDKG